MLASLRLPTPRKTLDHSLAPLRVLSLPCLSRGPPVQCSSKSLVTVHKKPDFLSRLSRATPFKLPRAKKRKRAQVAAYSAPEPTKVTRSRKAANNARAMKDGSMQREDKKTSLGLNVSSWGGNMPSSNTVQSMDGEHITYEDPSSSSHYGNGVDTGLFPQYGNTQVDSIPQPGQFPGGDASLDASGRHSAQSIQCPATFGAFNVPLWNSVNTEPRNTMPSMPHINPSFFNPAMMASMPGPFPMLPFYPMGHVQPMSTMAGFLPNGAGAPTPLSQRTKSPPAKPPKTPIAMESYLQQASQAPQKCPSRRPVLVILDLNGTLICRKHRKFPPVFAKREGLDRFLELLLQKYAVMIWSSSRPQNVHAICQKVFTGKQRKAIVAEWGRDKFGLTEAQYNSKVQVYKELSKVWSSREVQEKYPGKEAAEKTSSRAVSGGKFAARNERLRQTAKDKDTDASSRVWDQTNTILIDDSELKANSEPYNIIQVPEFINDPSVDGSRLFAKVLGALDLLSRHDDASKVMHQLREKARQNNCHILDLEDIKEDEDFWNDDDEDGGISLPPSAKVRKNEEASEIQDANPLNKVGHQDVKTVTAEEAASKDGKQWRKWKKQACRSEWDALEKQLRDQNKDTPPDKLKALLNSERTKLSTQQKRYTKAQWMARDQQLLEDPANEKEDQVQQRIAEDADGPLRLPKDQKCAEGNLKEPSESMERQEAEVERAEEVEKIAASLHASSSPSATSPVVLQPAFSPQSELFNDSQSTSGSVSAPFNPSATSKSSSTSERALSSKPNGDSYIAAIDSTSSRESSNAPSTLAPQNQQPASSPSPSPSPSENFLLDRLEESLGFTKTAYKEKDD